MADFNLFDLSRPERGSTGGEVPLQTHESVSVADLIAYNVPLQWFEAVAVVRQLCDAITGHDEARSTVPEPGDVRLTDQGDVVLMAMGPNASHSIKRLGLTLNALLEGTATPAELRLFVSQTTFEVPAYPSVADFARALAYFDRPERRQTLQALCARALAVMASGPQRAVEVSLPRERKVTMPGPLTSMQRRVVYYLSVAAAMLLAVFAVYRWVHSQNGVDTRGTLASAGEAAKGVLTEKMKDGLQTSQDLVEQGRNLLARTTGLISPTPVAALAPDPLVPASAPEPVKRTGKPRAKRLPATKPSKTFEISASLGELNTSVNLPPDPPPPARDPNVYSGDDAGVTPPMMAQKALPQIPPAGTNPETVGVVELLVNETGEVDDVKLITWPGRFQDRMILSAAKAWRFRPAVRDGQPVKFRQRVRVTQ